jgi:glutathione S-transferase
MLCEARKCKYALELVGFVPWSDVKITTPYGKTPTLKNYDKTKTKDLAHEKPIARYLASKLQFFGRDEDERAKIDEVYEQHWSTLRNNGLTHQGENFDMDQLLAITDREIEETPRFQDMRRVNSFSPSQRSLASLRVFDEILLQNQGRVCGF